MEGRYKILAMVLALFSILVEGESRADVADLMIEVSHSSGDQSGSVVLVLPKVGQEYNAWQLLYPGLKTPCEGSLGKNKSLRIIPITIEHSGRNAFVLLLKKDGEIIESVSKDIVIEWSQSFFDRVSGILLGVLTAVVIFSCQTVIGYVYQSRRDRLQNDNLITYAIKEFADCLGRGGSWDMPDWVKNPATLQGITNAQLLKILRIRKTYTEYTSGHLDRDGAIGSLQIS